MRRTVAITLAALLCLFYGVGHSVRTQAMTECLPGVTPYATGHMHINPCATLDTSQVQDRRADADVPRWTDDTAVCMAPDGTTPGQAFPCRWDARYQGGTATYTLAEPAGPGSGYELPSAS